MRAHDSCPGPSLPTAQPTRCCATSHQATPLGLDPAVAFSVSASRGLLPTPPPSPGATGNSLLQQILGEARPQEPPDMPLLGSCHIPQAQGDQLGPPRQALPIPCDLLQSSYLPFQRLNLPWDSSLTLGPSHSQPLGSPICTERLSLPGSLKSKICLLWGDFMESLECRPVAPRLWASHFTFLGLPFLTDAVGIRIKLSQKVTETGRVSPWYVVKYTKRARGYGDLTSSPWPYQFGGKSVPLPPLT